MAGCRKLTYAATPFQTPFLCFLFFLLTLAVFLAAPKIQTPPLCFPALFLILLFFHLLPIVSLFLLSCKPPPAPCYRHGKSRLCHMSMQLEETGPPLLEMKCSADSRCEKKKTLAPRGVYNVIFQNFKSV